MTRDSQLDLACFNLANGGLIDHNYHIKCENCRYGKLCDNAPKTAQVYATKHAIKHPGHVVVITDFGVVVERKMNERPTLDDESECPF